MSRIRRNRALGHQLYVTALLVNGGSCQGQVSTHSTLTFPAMIAHKWGVHTRTPRTAPHLHQHLFTTAVAQPVAASSNKPFMISRCTYTDVQKNAQPPLPKRVATPEFYDHACKQVLCLLKCLGLKTPVTRKTHGCSKQSLLAVRVLSVSTICCHTTGSATSSKRGPPGLHCSSKHATGVQKHADRCTSILGWQLQETLLDLRDPNLVTTALPTPHRHSARCCGVRALLQVRLPPGRAAADRARGSLLTRRPARPAGAGCWRPPAPAVRG